MRDAKAIKSHVVVAWWRVNMIKAFLDNQLSNRRHFSSRRLIHRDTKPMPLTHCQTLNKSPSDSSHTHDHRSEARLRIDPKVLVFVETTYSKLGREIAEELVYNRIKWVNIKRFMTSDDMEKFRWRLKKRKIYWWTLISSIWYWDDTKWF